MDDLCPREVELWVTLQEAERKLGLRVWLLRRAAKKGLFPIYRIGNSRIRVRISEIEKAILRLREGGSQ